jgi:hypothetical protein
MDSNIEKRLIEIFEAGKCYSVPLYESYDVSNMACLDIFVRLADEESVKNF